MDDPSQTVKMMWDEGDKVGMEYIFAENNPTKGKIISLSPKYMAAMKRGMIHKEKVPNHFKEKPSE
jgi:hypothetical protein